MTNLARGLGEPLSCLLLFSFKLLNPFTDIRNIFLWSRPLFLLFFKFSLQLELPLLLLFEFLFTMTMCPLSLLSRWNTVFRLLGGLGWKVSGSGRSVTLELGEVFLE